MGSSVVLLVPVSWLVSTNSVQYTWHGDWDKFSIPYLSTHLNSPSPFTSLIYENVFGLKPGGLINLIYIYKQSWTQSHKKYDLTLPLLASFGPQTSERKMKNKRPPQYDVSAHLSMLVQLL